VKDTIELNAIPKEQIKDSLESAPAVQNLLKSGGIMAVLAIPVVALVIIAVLVGRCLYKKYPKIKQKVVDIQKVLFFATFIQVINTGFIPMCVSSGLGKNWCI
jgi:hypothetical protein